MGTKDRIRVAILCILIFACIAAFIAAYLTDFRGRDAEYNFEDVDEETDER